jgi:anti-sigma B factor antagonist
MNEFRIQRSESDHATLVVEGELDVFTSPHLREELVQLEQTEERRIRLDLSQVNYLDSTGLSVIVGSHKRLTADSRELWIVGASPQVKRVFDLLGMNGWLKEVPVETNP